MDGEATSNDPAALHTIASSSDIVGSDAWCANSRSSSRTRCRSSQAPEVDRRSRKYVEDRPE